MRRLKSGGGWAAILYSLRQANRVGWRQMWRAMRAKNACKTCALGMGGQAGGMVNETGHFPEVCKKSFQAMVADMQAGIRPEFFQKLSIAQLQSLSPRELEWCGRLTQPLCAGPNDTHFQPISWDSALSRVAGQLKSIRPDECFFYASGRSSNEAGFLLQLFARLYGTNFVNNCSYYCHQASGVGLNSTVGTGTATVTLDDVEHANLFVLIGGNPASNHPRLMASLKNIRRRGGHVIVVNPVKEVGLVNFRVPSDVRSLIFGTKIASLYVQPHIGGDIALLAGVAKVLLNRGAFESSFISSATEGFESFRQHLEATSWQEIERQSGVYRATMEKFAGLYAAAKNVIFGWTMGVTQHAHGVGNVQAIVNLALMRGMVGRPHAGLLPIRGHSNVQGLGTVGVVPNLKQAILDNLERVFDVKLPRSPGLDTMGCMQAADRGEMKMAVCLGGNLYGSNPDAVFAKRALGKLELVVYQNTSLNTGLVHGRGRHTLILPVCARDEDSQSTTQESMFNFVRLSDGGPKRLQGPRTEVSIITAIARQVFDGERPVIDWAELEKHQTIRALIAKIVPGLEQLGAIDQEKTEFTILGRTLHAPKFATPSGKAKFTVVPIPKIADTAGINSATHLTLMTVRSEGQFNTVVYEDEDIYRGQERRDVILMNPVDLERLGLMRDQRVTVRSAAGIMRHILVRPFDIRAGNCLMYYPEANILVPTDVDPESKTPAFKAVAVTIEPEGVVAEPMIASRRELAVVH